MPDFDGVMFRVGFRWDGTGAPSLTEASASPIRSPSPGPSAEGGGLRAPDPVVDAFVLGGAALTAVGVGIAARAARGEGPLAAPEDLVLDALTGAELGACLVSTPQAEAICLGALTSLPLQIINRELDPNWDYRVGMATASALSLVRSELGGNPVPFAGYRVEDGRPRFVTSELVANGFVDVAFDASFFALSNTIAAALSGVAARELPNFALAGGGYGAGLSALTNIALGAPLRLSEGLVDAAVANAAESGLDVSDVARYTTWRAGGIWHAAAPYASITLSRQVAIAESHLEPHTVSHELTHRDQIAGTPDASGSAGIGTLSFYGQYLAWAPRGYLNNPYEQDAFHVGDGSSRPADPDEVIFGDAIGAPFSLALVALPAFLMTPRPRRRRAPRLMSR